MCNTELVKPDHQGINRCLYIGRERLVSVSPLLRFLLLGSVIHLVGLEALDHCQPIIMVSHSRLGNMPKILHLTSEAA